jgi:hypothetical protein
MTDISQQLQALQPQMSVTNQMQYVNNRQSAEAYQMQPNSSVVLWDSNSDKFYVKQSDASGFCTVKAFEYKEKVEEKETPTEYVTKGEFDELKALVDKLSTKTLEQPRKGNNGGTKA